MLGRSSRDSNAVALLTLSKLPRVSIWPMRLQLGVTFAAGVLLVAGPLYLWRRPQGAEVPAGAAKVTTNGESANKLSTGPVSELAAGSPVEQLAQQGAATGSVVRRNVIRRGRISFDELKRSCADSATGGYPQTDCAPLPSLEKFFQDAVVENASCVPGDGSGTIPLVLTADFRKKKPLSLFAQKRGRTLRHGVVSSCVAMIGKAISSFETSDGSDHKRYKLEWTVAYASASREGQ